MIATIRNKELGIFELLSFGWNIFIKNLNAILMIIFLIDLPVKLFNFLYANALTLNEQEILSSQENANIFFIFIWLFLPLILYSILSFFTFCLSNMAVIFIAEQYISNEKNQYSKALKKSFSRLGFGFTAALKSVFRISFLLPFFIIPGIIYYIKYFFVLHACILREKDSQSALDYSSSLVKGRLFRSFFTIISLIFILILLPAILVSNFSSLLLPQSSEFIYDNSIYNVVFQIIFMLPFYLFTVVNTVFFLNLDYRK